MMKSINKNKLLKKLVLALSMLIFSTSIIACSKSVSSSGDMILDFRWYPVYAGYSTPTMFDPTIINSKKELKEFMDSYNDRIEWGVERFPGSNKVSFENYSLKYDDDFFADKTLVLYGAFADISTGIWYEFKNYIVSENGIINLQIKRVKNGIGSTAIVHNIILFELNKTNNLTNNKLNIIVID